MNFEFSTVNRIVFSCGAVAKLGALATSMGHRALLVCGAGSFPVEALQADLASQGLESQLFRVKGEPDLATLEAGLALLRTRPQELVIAIGGGSVLDAGKALAALATNPGEVMDYLEVVGRGLPFQNAPLPMIAVPTTSGTGAEVTRNAVIGVPEKGVKVSMRGSALLPGLALVDPELTLSCPPSLTAASGFDALTQNLEAFTTLAPNPISDALAIRGLQGAASSFRRVYMEGSDLKAREEMSLCSLFGGLCLANAGLGAVHGFAGVLGGMYGAPHGAICASLLVEVVEANVRACAQSAELVDYQRRFRRIMQVLCANDKATIADGLNWLRETRQGMALPSLKGLGVRREDFELIIQKARGASSMKKNPLVLSNEELMEILEKAF